MALSSQCSKVVAYVERYGSINSIEAIRHHGITRLAARIHDLRGTNRAMKSVKDKHAAQGFVKYVPDWKQRSYNLRQRMNQELRSAQSAAEVANVNIKYAAKFSLMNIKETEHV